MSEHEDYHKEVYEHLEYLGYELKEQKAEKGYVYVATKPGSSTLLVLVFNKMTLLRTLWSGFQTKAIKSRDFFETINEINQNNMGKWYYEVDEKDDDVTILTEMDYYDYKKSTFGQLVENLDSEVANNIQKFEKFLKD